MASVKITQALANTIRLNCVAPFNKQISALQESVLSKEVLQKAARAALEAAPEYELFKEFNSLAQKIRAQGEQLNTWMSTHTQLNACFYVGAPHNRQEIRYTLPAHEGMLYPTKYGYRAFEINLDDAPTKTEEQVLIYKTLHQILDLSEERDNLHAAVNRILAQCNTLKQAVEVMPSFIELVPEETRRKYYAKPIPRKKEAETKREDLELDATQFNSLVLKSKLFNSM